MTEEAVRTAMVLGSDVINVVMAPPGLEFDGYTVVQLPDNSPVARGWQYKNGEFISPGTVTTTGSLEEHRAWAMKAIVDYINEATNATLTQYPAAEVESWPIQLAEANAVLKGPPSLDKAPFLVNVCAVQFGPANNATRLEQLVEKAHAVKTNADAWAGLAAYVNGLRARVQLSLMYASTIEEIDAAIQAGLAEGESFREAHGL